MVKFAINIDMFIQDYEVIDILLNGDFPEKTFKMKSFQDFIKTGNFFMNYPFFKNFPKVIMSTI